MPGRVGAELEARGFALDICRPCIGHPLPEALDEHAGVVIFGGPMSANDCGSLDFIRCELEWMPTVLASGTPFLGICLGAQLLTRAIGGRVLPHPEGRGEMGYYPVFPTPAAGPLFPAPMHVYQWHSEGCEPPRDATVLAEGGDFPVQAFRWGSRAYGIQFHPEVTLEMMQRWTTKGAHRLVTPGAQPAEEHLAGHARHDAALGGWLNRFLDHWVGHAGPGLPGDRVAHGNHAAVCTA